MAEARGPGAVEATAVKSDGRQSETAGRVSAWPSSGFVLGLALVAVYIVVRTLALPEPVLIAWTAGAVVATLVSPTAGLTVLAAIGPFTEALTDDGRVTAAPVLVAALGGAVVLHALLARRMPRPSLPLGLALLLWVGTALGVANTTLSFGTEAGVQAAQLWVPGLGGGLTVLLASAWVAQRREIHPLLVVMASVAMAAILSAADVMTAGQVRQSMIGWLLRAETAQERLGGIIPAPNAAAAILLVALAVCVAALLFARRRDFRLLAAAALPSLAAAMILTYSRSALLALAAVAGIVAWHVRRVAGVAIVVAALALAIAVAPGFLSARGVVSNPADPPGIGQTRGDEQRAAAWAASVRMWLDAPLTGQGFRSFEWLYEHYDAAGQDAPHNEWLRLFAEGGVFVGLAGVAFALSTVYVLARSQGWIGVGSAAAAASLFVMACFNNPFLYSQVNVPAFLVIGTGLGLALPGPPLPNRPARPGAPEPSERS